MQPTPPGTSICATFGGLLEETPGGGLGCMSRLLRAGIGREKAAVYDSTPDALAGGVRFGVYEIYCHADGSLCELGRGDGRHLLRHGHIAPAQGRLKDHLARANYLYYCLRDYNGALANLEAARRSLPNDPRIFELSGYILRRRGQQEGGVRNLEGAVELDPRNPLMLQQVAISYQQLRRYPEEAAVLDRALTIVPNGCR